MEEYFFSCPYCSAEISVLIDVSGGNQSYVEDCEVCCNPIDVGFTVEEGEIENFVAKILE